MSNSYAVINFHRCSFFNFDTSQLLHFRRFILNFFTEWKPNSFHRKRVSCFFLVFSLFTDSFHLQFNKQKKTRHLTQKVVKNSMMAVMIRDRCLFVKKKDGRCPAAIWKFISRYINQAVQKVWNWKNFLKTVQHHPRNHHFNRLANFSLLLKDVDINRIWYCVASVHRFCNNLTALWDYFSF